MDQRTHKSTLVSTAEAAGLLGVSITTVNRWAVLGKLTPATPEDSKGARFYMRDEIEALAATAKPKVSL